MRRCKNAPDPIDDILERLGLAPEIRKQETQSISGGESARVAIARMLMIARPVLLLDEPTAALDMDRSAQIIPLIRANVAAETAIVIVSHDPTLRPYADVVFQVQEGTLV